MRLEDFGYWFSGFIAAEGSFIIIPNGTTYQCRFTISLRQDDHAVLRQIQERLEIGTYVPYIRRHKGTPETMWTVMRQGDCKKLRNFLHHFPLRAKKARDFEVWAQAIDHIIYNQPKPDWQLIANYMATLKSLRPYNPIAPVIPSDAVGFNQWLTGFVEGEGCFQIRKRVKPHCTYYPCEFTLRLRQDDREVLYQIVKQTGIGYIDNQAPYHQENPKVVWNVTSKKDILNLIHLLDTSILLTKKSKDYRIWREAALIWGSYRPRVGHSLDWDHISSLRDQLMAQRAYQEVRLNS